MNKATPWIILIVVLVVAGAWYLMSRPPAEEHPSVHELPAAAPAVEQPVAEFPVAEIQVPPEPAPAPAPLPPLEESDAAMIEALAGLAGPEFLDAYFVLEQIISRIVATVDSLPSRQIAPLVLPLKPAAGPFLVLDDGDATVISPANAERYASYARVADSVDTNQAAALYVLFYPLFQEAFEALGYPDAYFNDRLVEVIDHLLETPETEGPVRLVRPEAVYLYEDEALESLSAGQKLLIRMGGENADVFRNKLREFRSAITRQDL